MLHGKEKLYFLLNIIEDKRAITSQGKTLTIDSIRDLHKNIRNDEISSIFVMLAEQQIIKLIKAPEKLKKILKELEPYDYSDDDLWHINLLPSFDRYFEEIQQEDGYFKFSGRTPQKNQLNRKSLEKIWNVLQEIEVKRGITPDSDNISIPHVHLSKTKNFRQTQQAAEERFGILKKLENERVLKDIRNPDSFGGLIYFKIDDNYFNAYNAYEICYKQAAKDYVSKTKNTTTQDLSLLHPEVFHKCKSLFEKAEYPEAVEKSFKIVKDRLRELTTFEKPTDAFGKGKLRIRGAAAEHVANDFNEGVKFLTMAIGMFKNEKGHTSDSKIDDPQRAYEYLSLSSLAMNLLDQAEIL